MTPAEKLLVDMAHSCCDEAMTGPDGPMYCFAAYGYPETDAVFAFSELEAAQQFLNIVRPIVLGVIPCQNQSSA
jgi:hypothetical protein